MKTIDELYEPIKKYESGWRSYIACILGTIVGIIAGLIASHLISGIL